MSSQTSKWILGILLSLPVVTEVALAQPYVPSRLTVAGYPILIPIAVWDKQSGTYLRGKTFDIASRPNFGVVRYTESGYMAYFPDRYPVIPDSFIYSINDAEGYNVKVKVLIDPRRRPISVEQLDW